MKLYYCVLCSAAFDANGLVCLACRKLRMQEEKGKKEMLQIQYCSSCGKTYHPRDKSIRHLSCFEGDYLHSSPKDAATSKRKKRCSYA